MKHELLAALALACVGSLSAGVFDDAKIWVRGAHDINGDGWVKTSRLNKDTQDFPNALKSGVASDPSHTWSGRGPSTNIHVVAGSVANPLAQATYNASYLHFDQLVWKTNETDEVACYGGLMSANFLPLVTNADPRTVFVRFRVDSFMSPTECANLVTLGYSDSSGKGAGWKLMLVPDEDGESFHFKIVNGRPEDNSAETGVGTREADKCKGEVYRLTTNMWADVVFACGHETGSWQADVYSCGEGKCFCADSDSMGWYSTQQSQSQSYNANCCLGAVGSANTPTADFRSFRGDIAAFAYWDRRLTKDEAVSVMASPRDEVFALGVKNGSADEFAGSAGVSVDAASALAFADVPKALAAGESMTVTFSMDDKNGYGLPQALRITGTTDAPAATFSAVPNGNTARAQKIEVPAGGTGLAVFRASAFESGENTFVITRTDAGETAFTPDCLAFGGSWSVGKRDNSHGEFGYTTHAITSRSTWTADANWKHTVINLASSGNWAANTLTAMLDPTLVANRKYKFVARLSAKCDKTATRREMTGALVVNEGTPRPFTLTTDDYDAYRNISFVFEPGELKPGVNTFRLLNYTESFGFISMDCRQLQLVPDPLGLLFLLK